MQVWDGEQHYFTANANDHLIYNPSIVAQISTVANNHFLRSNSRRKRQDDASTNAAASSLLLSATTVEERKPNLRVDSQIDQRRAGNNL